MALYEERVLVPSAARTSNGDSGTLSGYRSLGSARLHLDVTAVSGTGPTLNVVVEDTLDGATWAQVAAFTQQTAAGTTAINVARPIANRIRVRWTIAGTAPSFTFSVRSAELYDE